MNKLKTTTILVDTRELREHPLQSFLFPVPTETEIARLAEHCKDARCDAKIQICKDRTVIFGQDIVRALTATGCSTATATVRHDVGESDSGEALLELVHQYHRHHKMDEMSMGRCYKALRDRYREGRQRLARRDVTLIRIALANTNASVETIEQLGRLAELPRFVQDLISTNKLTKDQAKRLCLLPEEQKAIAIESIENGEPILNVLIRHGINKRIASKQSRQHPLANDPFRDPAHMQGIIAKANAEYERLYQDARSS